MRLRLVRHVMACGVISLIISATFACPVLAQEKPKLEIVPQLGHSYSVNAIAMAVTPDGQSVLSGSYDKTLKLWNLATGKLLRTFKGHSDSVNAVAVTPNGLRAVSGSSDHTLKLWDLATGELLRTFAGHSHGVLAIAITPGGQRVVSGGRDNTIKRWSLDTGKQLRTCRGHADPVSAVAVAPDGRRVLSGSWDSTLEFRDLATGKLLRTFAGHSAQEFEGHYYESLAMAITPDGRRVVSGNWDGTLKLRDLESGELIRTFKGHSIWVRAVAVTPDGQHMISGSMDYISGNVDFTIRLWNLATGKQLRTFGGDTSNVMSAAVTPDGQLAVSGSWDNTLKLWNFATGELLRTFKGHSGNVSAVAVTPDGRRLVSGSADNTLKLWDLATGRLLRTFKDAHARYVTAVAVTLDGRHIVSGGEHGWLKLWGLESGKLLHTFQEVPLPGVTAVAVTPDGRRMVSGSSDGTLKLWSLATGKRLRTFKGHSELVSSVAVTPDGRRMVSGNWDGTIKLWSLTTGRLLRTFKGHSGNVSAVAVTPDGRRIVSGGSHGGIKLWGLESGKLLHTFEGHASHVTAVAVTPDGRRAVSGSTDGTLKLWDFKSETRRKPALATLIGGRHDEWLTITPAGFFMASAEGANLLSVVRGFEPYSVLQFFDHLYRPDLVVETLKGDPEGNYEDAASKLNLEKILDSGPAPEIELRKTEKAGDTVRLTLRLVGTGGGIGRKLIWRVNGLTQGDPTPPELEGLADDVLASATVTQTLQVDPGQTNTVEVTAYNGAGLLATPPLRITIDAFGVTTEERPRMYVLALGVNTYRMKDYQLRYAVKDAQEFAEALKVVGSTLFAEVSVMPLLNEQVNEENIAAAFDKIAAEAKPTDVFVLFVSGHGRSVAGRYYYYPQNLDFASRQTYQDGIGQDMWQKWLAKVPAQKTLLIFDTCESGAAGRLIRGTDSVRQTAMDQLQHATGHNLIAAAGSTKPALEGYKGHGVLTYALLAALTKKEGVAGEEKVKVGTLADYVDEHVPTITQRVWGEYQKPVRKLSGHDFPIGFKVAALRRTADEEIPSEPTHVLIRPERVRETPATDAPGERQLVPGTQVRVVELVGDWAIIAREGEKMGYVPVEALAKIQ